MAEIQKQSSFKAFRTVDYDTLKIYVKAHGFKVQQPKKFEFKLNLDTKSDYES